MTTATATATAVCPIVALKAAMLARGFAIINEAQDGNLFFLFFASRDSSFVCRYVESARGCKIEAFDRCEITFGNPPSVETCLAIAGDPRAEREAFFARKMAQAAA